MKKFVIPILTVVMVVSIIFAGCAGGAEEPAPETESLAPTAEEPEAEAPTTPELPKPGEWTASTGCSEFAFTFTVNPDRTGIPEYSHRFAEFKCEGVQISGGYLTKVEPIRPITGGQFTIETEELGFGPVRYTWDIVIQGKFDETGRHASGTWEVSSEGTTCQKGTWEASAL